MANASNQSDDSGQREADMLLQLSAGNTDVHRERINKFLAKVSDDRLDKIMRCLWKQDIYRKKREGIVRWLRVEREKTSTWLQHMESHVKYKRAVEDCTYHCS